MVTDLAIILPEEISIFSDFIQDISTEEVDEYIEYIQNVIDGVYENFEITLNATSASIKSKEKRQSLNIIIELKNLMKIKLKQKNS
ncbi:hypothetical protein C2W59_01065 [Bacillus pumilus]|nr:hypothetical protein C2W59_01065 [Bacillus pumilus]